MKSAQATSFNLKSYYTHTTRTYAYPLRTKLVNRTSDKPCNTSVLQGNTENTILVKTGYQCDLMFYKGLTSAKFQRIFCLTTSFSGINRTRQQAVFLRLLFGQLFKPFYGGLRKGNTKPSGNILRRLNAVVITRHLNTILVVILLKRSGGHNYV
jgi:hypothetical protein